MISPLSSLRKPSKTPTRVACFVGDQATLELFDKWGRRYEGSAVGTGAAKITATWRELMKDAATRVEVVEVVGGEKITTEWRISP